MKKVNYKSIIIDDINTWDYPDFCDAFVSYAEYEDGTPLNDDQLDQLNDEKESWYNFIIERVL